MKDKIFHIGKIGKEYLFLKKSSEESFEWYRDNAPTGIKALSPEEACRIAKKEWKEDFFSFLNCGVRFTLPERDEHGSLALFYQMCSSYNSMTGIYFEEELGHSCIVKNASHEAIGLWRKFK